jgi:DNA-binding Lrp family transcriptional regulator
MPVQAYVFVTTTNPGPRAACRAIRKIPGVVRADALFGGPAVIAIVEGRDLAEMDAPIDAIVQLPMVTDTETHVVRQIEEEDAARARLRRTNRGRRRLRPPRGN